MVSHSDTVNISNMPATSETVYDPSSTVDADLSSLLSTLSKDIQWKITKFQASPPMSTYLVAFANGPFSYLEKSVVMPLSGRTVPLRVYGEHSWWTRTGPSSQWDSDARYNPSDSVLPRCRRKSPTALRDHLRHRVSASETGYIVGELHLRLLS
jgi:hypothetical protein